MLNASIIVALSVIVGLIFVAIFYASRYKKVKHQGEVIIINGYSKVEASFTGGFVWPVINSYEYMDITRKKISLTRIGKEGATGEETEGLHCRDNIRADLKVDFYIGVNQTVDDVKTVANLFKPSEASNINVLIDHFSPKFSESLKTACKKFDFEDLFVKRDEFKTAVIEVIGKEMDGFKIYDVVIDKIEQTALEAHNKNNVLDSAGIEKIVSITSQRNIQTNIIRQDETTKIKAKDVSAEEERLQLIRTLKKAEAVNLREVSIIQSKEKAEAKEKEEEYILQESSAKIKREQEEGVLNVNKQLEIDVATLNNDKKIKIQTEDVARTEELEKVETSKRVAEVSIKKDLVLENGMKEVADVTSQRVEIERKIAKEEEETANLRAIEKANRDKKVLITNAEAEAEAKQTEEITKAKAEFLSAEETTKKEKLEAEAHLFVKSKEAEGVVAMADAKQKDISAIGLAEVEVEKERANAIKLIGNAEAGKIREVGNAEAEAKKSNLEAAESGSEESREFDKWQRKIDMDEKVKLAEVDSQKEIGIESAKAMGNTLQNAEIKLFGGDDISSIRDAVMGGAKIDAKISGSKHLSNALERYEGNEENLIQDVLSVLQKTNVSTGDIANIGISKFLSENPGVINDLKGLLSK